MNKFIYIRTSTDEQTPHNQIKDIQNMFNLVLEECEVFSDKQSAWKDFKEREQFEKLKKKIKTSKESELYVWDWDRLFRNRKRLKEFFQFCVINKCKIHSFGQNFFENFYTIPAPFNEIIQELVIDLLGWLAEDESTKKSNRVKMAVRKRDGKPTISYKGKKWGRKGFSTQKINQMTKLRDEGLGVRAIARELNISPGAVSKTFSKIKV